MNSLYLFINLGAVAIPFAFSFHPRIRFYKFWPQAFAAIFLPMALFIPWDMLFTAEGHWGFSPEYLTGFHLGNLPLEEVLFFICIPYACLFTYFCFNMQKPSPQNNRNIIHFIPAAIFLILAIIFREKAYTGTTFLLLSIFQIISIYTFRASLVRFYASYAVLLVPFFMVNGLLTGTGIEGEVVWYNNAENLGVRLLTIPVEDVFYGMLLVQMNVFVFEWLRRKKPVKLETVAAGEVCQNSSTVALTKP